MLKLYKIYTKEVIMVLRGQVTPEKLTNIYDTINRIVNNKNCYYEDKDVKKIKENKKNILLKCSSIKGQKNLTLFLYKSLTFFIQNIDNKSK